MCRHACVIALALFAGKAAAGPIYWTTISTDDSNEKCLQVDHARKGSLLSLERCTGETNQLFSFDFENRITTKAKPGELCLDVPTESGGAYGTRIKLWSCGGSRSMQWKILYDRSGNKSWRAPRRIQNAAEQFGCVRKRSTDNGVIVGNCGSSEAWHFQQQLAFPTAVTPGFSARYATDWMHDLYKDHQSAKLSEIVVPGTHDAGTYYGFVPLAKTQGTNIKMQLTQGVRHLDIRVGYDELDKVLRIWHGRPLGSPQWSSVLDAIQSYVEEHRQEVLFVDFHAGPSQPDQFAKAIKMAHDKLGSYLFKTTTKKLGDVTFRDIYAANKPVIFLVREWERVPKEYHSKMWNKGKGNENWEEAFANSDKAAVIKEKMYRAMKTRRTSRMSSVAITATPQGPWNLSVWQITQGVRAGQSSWITDWYAMGWVPNVIPVDYTFYGLSVGTAITLNAMALSKPNRSHVCIKSDRFDRYLSDSPASQYDLGTEDRCGHGGRWEIYSATAETFCLRNLYTNMFLSDTLPKNYHKCHTRERWLLEKSGDRFCIRNAYLMSQNKPSYLYDGGENGQPRFSSQCLAGEKWRLDCGDSHLCGPPVKPQNR